MPCVDFSVALRTVGFAQMSGGIHTAGRQAKRNNSCPSHGQSRGCGFDGGDTRLSARGRLNKENTCKVGRELGGGGGGGRH